MNTVILKCIQREMPLLFIFYLPISLSLSLSLSFSLSLCYPYRLQNTKQNQRYSLRSIPPSMDVYRWNRGPKPKHHLSDTEGDLAGRPRGRKAEKGYPLHLKADNHTIGYEIPSATKSTIALDISESTGYYAPIPAPDHHGPNFEKGPLQAEIR